MPGAAVGGAYGSWRLRRIRRHSRQPDQTSAITTNNTSTGTNTATKTSPMLATSSTVDSIGAATPAVATFAAGRTAVLVSDTASATTTPIATGIHPPDLAHCPGSATAAVCAAVPEPNTIPPAAGRTNVWIESLTESSAGILSATISTTSRTAMIAITQPF
jgi:hypothetical protein